MEMTAVDVVVIGGGVQGLVILDSLMDVGYSCALVTDGDVGAGQTLHSHGFLNTGFGQFGDELPTVAREVVHPYLHDHGVALRGDWIGQLPPGLPGSTSLPSAVLPVGFAPGLSETTRKLPVWSFDKRHLIAALTRGKEDRIIRGTVTGFHGRDPVEAVRAEPAGDRSEVELRAKAVVVAAGCGSKRLLQDLVGATPQLEMIKHRLVHMVCLRAPIGRLPAISIIAPALGLLLAAHEDGEHVTWYVTPMEMAGPSFDDVPSDAVAAPNVDMLKRAASLLETVYPLLPEIEGLQVGHYAGYRQDIGDAPAARLCAVIDGAPNVIAALPSGLVAPWLNAGDTLKLVRGLVAPNDGEQPTLPHGGEGVRAGSPVEDRPGFAWRSWEEWQQALLHVGARGRIDA